MDQVAGCSNPIENMEGIPDPNTEGVANSPISFHFSPLFFSSPITDDESTTLIETNKRLKNKTGSEKTKILDAETKNLKEASIPAGSRKLMEIVATTPVIGRGWKNTNIIDSIKALKKHNGASFEDIYEYLEENYYVNMELKPFVSEFLKNSVQFGVLEKTNEASEKERFKLGKSANIENVPPNLLSKDGMQSKAEKQKVDDLPESGEMKEKVLHFPTSDMVTNFKNQTNECSSVIENLEAVPRPRTDVVLQTATTSETISSIVANKSAKSTKNKTGVEKSKTISAESENVKLVSASGNENLKRNATHPSTSEMVLDSIMALKMLNGATLDDISKDMEKKHQVHMKTFKSHVNKFLKKAVDEEILEKSSGINVEERYKIKKSENGKRDVQNIPEKKKKSKSAVKRLFDLDYFTSKHYNHFKQVLQ